MSQAQAEAAMVETANTLFDRNWQFPDPQAPILLIQSLLGLMHIELMHIWKL